MWQLLTSETEVFLQSGFLYLPLLYDPDIEAELEFLVGEIPPTPSGVVQSISENLIYTQGKYFIKSLSLASLVENYQVVFAEAYGERRRELLAKIFPEATVFQPFLAPRVKTILFEVAPHFLRSRGGWRFQKGREGGVLAYLAEKIPVPPGHRLEEERLRVRENSLRQALLRLAQKCPTPDPPQKYHGRGRELAGWLLGAVCSHLVAQEIRRWEWELAQMQELLNLPGPQLAALLAIAERGAMEVDGFGFCPDDKYSGEYLVYKRTGEFVLQDYFGRLYLFPDCRVAVSTAGPFHPMVLDHYKHPLLRRFGARQQICLNDYQPALAFGGAGVRQALEEGLNALFYGYNSRKRNGYNSLDGFGRHHSVVEFEDWRLPQTDSRVMRGELEVKNDAF